MLALVLKLSNATKSGNGTTELPVGLRQRREWDGLRYRLAWSGFNSWGILSADRLPSKRIVQ
jgi:hypothetical protein